VLTCSRKYCNHHSHPDIAPLVDHFCDLLIATILDIAGPICEALDHYRALKGHTQQSRAFYSLLSAIGELNLAIDPDEPEISLNGDIMHPKRAIQSCRGDIHPIFSSKLIVSLRLVCCIDFAAGFK
jgi:hypothetical protein